MNCTFSVSLRINPQYSPATSRVAFLLLALPTSLVATHQYMPVSCSLLVCSACKKNRDPLGSTIRFDESLTRLPSWYHSIVGSGLPSALQFKVAGSCLRTKTSDGCSVMRGGRCAVKKKCDLSL